MRRRTEVEIESELFRLFSFLSFLKRRKGDEIGEKREEVGEKKDGKNNSFFLAKMFTSAFLFRNI